MSEPIDNGGPAFAAMNETCGQDGMSLLDYFAGQALAGTMANENAMIRLYEQEGDNLPAFLAEANYKLATAMIAEKRRRETTI